MKKRHWLLTLTLTAALLLPMQVVQAEASIPAPTVQEEKQVLVQIAPEHVAEYEQAAAALLAHTPGAVIDYAVRERDDGRYDWDLFFTLDGQVGECEVAGSPLKVRSVVLRDLPENALTAAQAMDMLKQEKGDLQILDLELEREDGRLCYEGEALVENRRYEFTISVAGDILEWKRD